MVDHGREEAAGALEYPVHFSDRLIGPRILESELAHCEIKRIGS